MRMPAAFATLLALLGTAALPSCVKTAAPRASAQAAPRVPNAIRDLLERYPDLPAAAELSCTDQDSLIQALGIVRPVTSEVLAGRVPQVGRDLKPLTFARLGELFPMDQVLKEWGFGPFEVSLHCQASASAIQLLRGAGIDPSLRERLRSMGYQLQEGSGVSWYALPPGSQWPWREPWAFAAYDEGTLLLGATEDAVEDALTVPRADQERTPEQQLRTRLLDALGPQVSVSVLGPSLITEVFADLPADRRPDPRWSAAALGVRPTADGATLTVALRFDTEDQAVRGAAFLPSWSRLRKSVLYDVEFSDLWAEPAARAEGDLVVAAYEMKAGVDARELIFQRDLGFIGYQGATED